MKNNKAGGQTGFIMIFSSYKKMNDDGRQNGMAPALVW